MWLGVGVKKMKKFNFRVEDMEVRSCGEHLLLEGEHNRAEIIKWQKDVKDKKEFCYTVAYWKKTKEGYDLLFVGERPFKVDKDIFWQLAEQGQKLLEEANAQST